ncbi:hypothetical protein [Microbacterium kunmingense]|uniref:hypothetical protein n=1 Tax=Microbacterium kunmingense TaxID=2915939 RepID=UPI003D737FC3
MTLQQALHKLSNGGKVQFRHARGLEHPLLKVFAQLRHVSSTSAWLKNFIWW